MTDVRELLIERIARRLHWQFLDTSNHGWDKGFASDHDASRRCAADLLDSVFCDREVREAMVKALHDKAVADLGGESLDLNDEWYCSYREMNELHVESVMDLFGPVKETE